MDNWRADRANDWRGKLNMHYAHNREIRVTLRALPEYPLVGNVNCPIPDGSWLVTMNVPTGETITTVTLSLDDILTVSREVSAPTPVS
jgi:hypothetical protein